MNKRTIISLAIILLAVASVGGATMAWYTDSDEVGKNQFTSGTLMINIDGFDTRVVGANLDLDILNPGDKWCYELKVENGGNKTFYWRLGFFWDEVIGQKNTYTQSQAMIAKLEARDYGTNPMSEVLKVTITQLNGPGGSEILPALFDGTLSGATSPMSWPNLVTIAPGQSAYFKICFELPGLLTDDKYQGAKMQAGFAVQAWQTTNSAPAPGDPWTNPFVFFPAP